MCGVNRFGVVLLWMVVLCRVKTVVSQEKIQRFVGDSVLLPCIYRDQLPPSASIFWRDKDDSNVLDIVRNKSDVSSQDVKFRGRVSSFPERFKDGNFSISLETLQLSDSSSYVCHIPKVRFQQSVLLAVSGKRVETVTTTTPPPGSSGGTAVTPNMLHMFLLSPPLFLLFTR